MKEIWSYLDLFSLLIRDRKWVQTNKKLYMKKHSFDLVLIGRGVHQFLEGSFYDKCLLCFSHLGFNVYRESISQIQNINFLEEENNSVYKIYCWHIHNTYIHTQFYVCMGIYIKEISLYNPALYSIWKIYILLVSTSLCLFFFINWSIQCYFDPRRQSQNSNHHFHSKLEIVYLCNLSIIIYLLLYISFWSVTITQTLEKSDL